MVIGFIDILSGLILLYSLLLCSLDSSHGYILRATMMAD